MQIEVAQGYLLDKTDNTTRGGEAEWDELRFMREFAGRRLFPQNQPPEMQKI